MCGIAGYVTTAPGSQPVSVLERMTAALRHRGPDDSGCYTSAHAALGHRRLSIIDVAAAISRWPTRTAPSGSSTTAKFSITPDLRPALERAGHRYQTHCDTETILHAYEQYGADCVARFRGMFAFAIWDRRTGRCSARATGSGSSRSTTTGTAGCSRSLRKSRRCWSIRRFPRPSTKRCCRSIWPSAIRAARGRCFPAYGS